MKSWHVSGKTLKVWEECVQKLMSTLKAMLPVNGFGCHDKFAAPYIIENIDSEKHYYIRLLAESTLIQFQQSHCNPIDFINIEMCDVLIIIINALGGIPEGYSEEKKMRQL